jgi:N-acetylglutamate synthase-like GNAT family acetyltransferase
MPLDPNSTVIRPARPEDGPAVSQFIEPFVARGVLLPRTTEELGELLRCGYIAEISGTVVGFAALEIYSRKLAEVRSLAVSEEYQGHGIGRRLVDACLECAKRQNVLEVMAITSSEQFFRACGFDFTLPGEKKALFFQTDRDR